MSTWQRTPSSGGSRQGKKKKSSRATTEKGRRRRCNGGHLLEERDELRDMGSRPTLAAAAQSQWKESSERATTTKLKGKKTLMRRGKQQTLTWAWRLVRPTCV